MPLVKMTARYADHVARLLPEFEQGAVIKYVAANPEAGDLVAGTGGVRKLRWSMPGQGKRGGARVLHLFLRHRDTSWLLDVYAKRDKADLSPSDVKALHALVDAIKHLER